MPPAGGCDARERPRAYIYPGTPWSRKVSWIRSWLCWEKTTHLDPYSKLIDYVPLKPCPRALIVPLQLPLPASQGS